MENGEESTTEDEMQSAMITPTAPISPWDRNGTASGINAPRMPVVEANADTAAPMKQISSAASSGVPTSATFSPSQSIVPISWSSATYMTMPQISSTVGQATLFAASLVAYGISRERTTATVTAMKPMSHSTPETARPTSVRMPTRVRMRSRLRPGFSIAASTAPPPITG